MNRAQNGFSSRVGLEVEGKDRPPFSKKLSSGDVSHDQITSGTVELPPCGILTKSLVHSPVVQWIIPARIRGEEFNDVLFIGDNFVSLKEVQSNYHLKNIATKRNFHGRIRHAKVFGDSRKPASSHAGQFKTKDGVSNGHSSYSNYSHIKLPPQILVLSLDSGEIIFLFAVNTSTTQVKFILSRRDLPVFVDSVEQPGKLIAVDPRSRAMAISAQRNGIVIYTIHSMSDIRSQSSTSDQNHTSFYFDPIKRERIFTTEGASILRMEFLHTHSNEQIKDNAKLILLIARNGRQFIRTHEWNPAEPLSLVQCQKEIDIQTEEVCDAPLLLVPLVPSCAFLLVSEVHISIWIGDTDVLLQSDFSIAHPKTDTPNGVEAPLWTQWARPVRSKKMLSSRDCLYLAKEDGSISFIEIELQYPIGQPQPHLASMTPVDRFNCHIDTAFATLDVSMKHDDCLIVAGLMSQGGVKMIGPNKNPEAVQAIHNWTATSDICVTPKIASDDKIGPALQLPASSPFDQEALLACTGHNDHGAITQFRQGLEAHVRFNFDCFAGTTSIWAWVEQSGALFMVQSNAVASRLWKVPGLEGDTWSTVVKEVKPERCSFCWFKKTIAVGHFGEFVCQITEDGMFPVQISTKNSRKWNLERPPLLPLAMDSTHWIAMASVECTANLILCALKSNNSTHVLLYSIDSSATMPFVHLATTPDLTVELSCIAILKMDNQIQFAIATTTGFIQLYSQDNTRLVPTRQIVIGSFVPADDDLPVCESICVLSESSANSNPSGGDQLLLCGLRNGDLLCFTTSIGSSGEASKIQMTGRISVGTAPVLLYSDDQYPGEILTQCGSEFCHIRYEGNQKTRLQVNRIWLTDLRKSWQQAQIIVASCRIRFPNHCDSDRKSADIASIAGGEVQLLKLGGGVHTVPRSFSIHHIEDVKIDDEMQDSVTLYPKSQVGGTPRKVHYSEHLGLLVVAYTRMNAMSGEVLASLKLFQLESGRQISNDEELHGWNLQIRTKNQPTLGRPDERLLGIIDFFYTFNGSLQHLLVVHTGLIRAYDANDAQHQARDCGRILFLEVEQVEPNQPLVEVRQKMVYKQNNLIQDVVMLRLNVMVWSSNRILVSRVISKDTASWNTPKLFELPSRIRHLSVENELLYVSTFHGTFHILRFSTESESLQEMVERGAMHDAGFTQHLQLSGSPLVILNCQRMRKIELVGVDLDHTKSIETIAQAAFEPPLSRLVLCRIRPRWSPKPLFPVLAYINPDGRDIIGTSLNGTVLQISLLLPKAWDVLRFMEKLARLHVDSEQDRSSTDQLALIPESGEMKKQRIDGDLITEEIVDPGLEHFRAMVQARDERLLRGVGTQYRARAADNEVWLLRRMKEISPRGQSADYVAVAFQLAQELVGFIW